MKDPASIVCSYILSSREDFERLIQLRRHIYIGNYVKNVMVYAYLLAKTIDGQDLLGYDKLSFLSCPDPLYTFVYSIERMVYYGIEITSTIIVKCCGVLTAPRDHHVRDGKVEGRIRASIICPYCLGAPIKYGYYKSGHKKTKKHVLNREEALKGRNYYRYLLEKTPSRL